MKTRRGLSVALALAFVGVAPLAAQHPQHQEGNDHPMPHHQGSPMPMDHGACAMMASDVAQAQVASAGTALSNIAPSGRPRRRACQKKDSTPPMNPPYQTRPPRPKIG